MPKLQARILIAALILSIAGIKVAGAQSAPGGIPVAPIGHRQPTAGDVPADDSVQGGKIAVPSEDSTQGDVGDKGFGPALRALPKLDVQATCRRAQPLSGNVKSAYEGCLADEIGAQKELSRVWFDFKASSRSVCTQETKIGNAPSYVELITCLQLDKQAAEAEKENKKALVMPTTSRGKGAKQP